jgi:predicted short-subunit dehydrogenase-like oxidoreductase (DUF2520 family)
MVHRSRREAREFANAQSAPRAEIAKSAHALLCARSHVSMRAEQGLSSTLQFCPRAGHSRPNQTRHSMACDNIKRCIIVIISIHSCVVDAVCLSRIFMCCLVSFGYART